MTAELIECSLNSSGGEDAPLPTWDTLMGINSFSIERALQVRRWVLKTVAAIALAAGQRQLYKPTWHPFAGGGCVHM